jgi:hypothetical protein
MYTRPTRKFPAWLVVALAMLLIFGACYLWRGLLGFFETGGNIAAATPVPSTLNTTMTITVAPLNYVFASRTPAPPCQEFFVNVIRARVRECPSETCDTLETPNQNAIICVYGVAPDAPDWYRVNLDPNEPIPRIGYMHNSVIDAVHPTKRPTQTPLPTLTFTPLPTITPVPNRGASPAVTPPPTLKPVPTLHSA